MITWLFINLFEDRIIVQEYIGSFSIIIKNKNSQTIFQLVFYLSEFCCQWHINVTIISSISGNIFFYDALQSFGAELTYWNYVDRHLKLLCEKE